MIRSIVLTLAFATIAYSMTTMPSHHHGHHQHATHPPKEHPEKGVISFFYDQHTHYMAGKTSEACYIMALSSPQQISVHTDAGLDMLELNMIRMITGGETTLDQNDLMGDHVNSIVHFCHGRQMYDLGIKPAVATAHIPTAIPTLIVN